MNHKSSGLISEQETQFAGNLLINTRTITQTSSFFQKITEQRSKSQTITVRQLSELLVLLEAISTSKELVYDGSVPERETDKIQKAEDLLETQIGNQDIFRGIQPDNEKQKLQLCKAGIQQSSRILRDRIQTFQTSSKPITERLRDVRRLNIKSARAFAAELMKPLVKLEDREARSIELIDQNPFNGAKCAAGILVTEPKDDHSFNPDETGVDIRTLCRQMVQNRSDEELSCIVPMMMNAFRSNFLNSLGAEHGSAAFFAGPEIEHVMDQQMFLLGSYVTGQLVSSQLAPELLESALGDQFQSTNQFPFLGLLTLLRADDGDPYSVFRCSLSDKDQLLARFMAKKGGQKRYIHDFTERELSDFKGEKLDAIFQKMEKRVQVFTAVDRVNHKILQPTTRWYNVYRPLINAALGEADMDFGLGELPGGTGEAVTYLVNKVLMPDEYLRYATFTHSITKRLDLALRNRGDQDIITERVSKVLGCELIKN